MAKSASKQTLTVGIFALFMAIISVYGLRLYFRQEQIPPPERKPSPPPMVIVPIAAVDLPADRVLSPGDVATLPPMTQQQFQERFRKYAGENFVMKIDQLMNRRLSKPIRRGQPFPTTSLYLSGTGPNIASRLQPGYRAVRVEVPNVHDGGVQPGSFTDVLFRAHARAATKDGQPAIPEKTITLLRDIEVLEVERPMKPGQPGKPPQPTGKTTTVTLAVPAEKAEIFGVIAGRGEVWLEPTPKAGSDTSVADVQKASTLADLLGIQPPKKPTPPPPPFETAIYTGGRLRQVNKFVDGKLISPRYGEPRKREAVAPSGTPAENATPPATLPGLPAVSDATTAVPTFSEDD